MPSFGHLRAGRLGNHGTLNPAARGPARTQEYLCPGPWALGGQPTSRAVKKTTIDLDIELFKKLKQFSLDTDRSVRIIVSEAIAEKLSREARQAGPGGAVPGRLIKRNPVADAILSELLSIFPEELAVRLLSQKCAEQAVTPEALRAGDITPGFIESLSRPVEMMSPGRSHDFSRRLEVISKGG